MLYNLDEFRAFSDISIKSMKLESVSTPVAELSKSLRMIPNSPRCLGPILKPALFAYHVGVCVGKQTALCRTFINIGKIIIIISIVVNADPRIVSTIRISKQ